MLTTQEIRQLGNKEMMDELQKSRRELLKSQFDVRNGISKEVHAVLWTLILLTFCIRVYLCWGSGYEKFFTTYVGEW